MRQWKMTNIFGHSLALMALAIWGVSCQGESGGSERSGDAPKEVPGVTLLAPHAGDPGGGDTITIETEGFSDDFTLNPPMVYFDNIEAISVVAENATTVRVATPTDANPDPQGHAVDVTVLSESGTQEVFIESGFTYMDALDNCLSVSPGSGPVSGGNLLTISLPNHTLVPGGTARLAFDGVCGDLGEVIVDEHTITVVVPEAQQPGPVEILVVAEAVGDLIFCVTDGAYTYQ